MAQVGESFSGTPGFGADLDPVGSKKNGDALASG
jgi:hypothetical protein